MILFRIRRKMESISIRRISFVLASVMALPLAGLCQANAPTAATSAPVSTPPAGASTTTPPPAPTSAQAPGAAESAGAAQTAAATAASPVVDAATYVIGPEDGLQVTVWKDPTLSGTFPVRPDGMISMTLLNDVQAAGLTPMQLTASLTEKLKKYIQDPIVSVVV